jgi:hypothetical protein
VDVISLPVVALHLSSSMCCRLIKRKRWTVHIKKRKAQRIPGREGTVCPEWQLPTSHSTVFKEYNFASSLLSGSSWFFWPAAWDSSSFLLSYLLKRERKRWVYRSIDQELMWIPLELYSLWNQLGIELIIFGPHHNFEILHRFLWWSYEGPVPHAWE